MRHHFKPHTLYTLEICDAVCDAVEKFSGKDNHPISRRKPTLRAAHSPHTRDTPYPPAHLGFRNTEQLSHSPLSTTPLYRSLSVPSLPCVGDEVRFCSLLKRLLSDVQQPFFEGMGLAPHITKQLLPPLTFIQAPRLWGVVPPFCVGLRSCLVMVVRACLFAGLRGGVCS